MRHSKSKYQLGCFLAVGRLRCPTLYNGISAKVAPLHFISRQSHQQYSRRLPGISFIVVVLYVTLQAAAAEASVAPLAVDWSTVTSRRFERDARRARSYWCVQRSTVAATLGAASAPISGLSAAMRTSYVWWTADAPEGRAATLTSSSRISTIYDRATLNWRVIYRPTTRVSQVRTCFGRSVFVEKVCK